jgi:hypothetical protein
MGLTIAQRLDELAARVDDDSFLTRRGLGNEAAVWIFDYHPAEEMFVRQFLEGLVDKSRFPGSQRKIAKFDLYDIALSILEERGLLDRLAETEERRGPEYLLEAIKSVLPPQAYVDAMNEALNDERTVFITGVGRVWPWIRSHTILGNLTGRLEELPVILFFPGTYSGTGMRLFNLVGGESYYRAFQMVPNR